MAGLQSSLDEQNISYLFSIPREKRKEREVLYKAGSWSLLLSAIEVVCDPSGAV